jgi:prolyl 4-hydroxylase
MEELLEPEPEGRGAEPKQVDRALLDMVLVLAIVGPPRCGKTCLAKSLSMALSNLRWATKVIHQQQQEGCVSPPVATDGVSPHVDISHLDNGMQTAIAELADLPIEEDPHVRSNGCRLLIVEGNSLLHDAFMSRWSSIFHLDACHSTCQDRWAPSETSGTSTLLQDEWQHYEAHTKLVLDSLPRDDPRVVRLDADNSTPKQLVQRTVNMLSCRLPATVHHKTISHCLQPTAVPRISVETVPLSTTTMFPTVQLDSVLGGEECQAVIDMSEGLGFDAPENGSGTDERGSGYSARCTLNDPTGAHQLWLRIRQFLPAHLQGWHIVGLNERMRIIRYFPGEFFAQHRDGHFTRGREYGQRAGQMSMLSVMLYLNSPGAGGGLHFIDGSLDGVTVQPQSGRVVIFDQLLFHESEKVSKGVKYAIRTDVMFGKTSETPPGARKDMAAASPNDVCTFPKLLARMDTACRKQAVLFACGSYNPIHVRHLAILELARKFLEYKGFDVVGAIISPSHDLDIATKGCKWVASKHRIEMCKIATAEKDWVEVDIWESSQAEHPSFRATTRSLLTRLRRQMSSLKPSVFYVCGVDHFTKFGLSGGLGRLGVIALGRRGHNHAFGDQLMPEDVFVIEESAESDDVSSTRIRQSLLVDGADCAYAASALDEGVRVYIAKHMLYK